MSELELVSKQTKKLLFQACSQGLVLAQRPPLRVIIRFDRHVPVQSFFARSPMFTCLFLGNAAYQVLQETLQWVTAFSDKKYYHLPTCFSLCKFSGNREIVFNTIMKIPFGEVRTLSSIASATHIPEHEVDTICNDNPLPLFIPCHRVLRNSQSYRYQDFYKDLRSFENSLHL